MDEITKTQTTDHTKGMIKTARGEYIPGYLWTPEDGWYDETDIERQVGAILEAVLHANVAIDPETRSHIVRTLTRLKYMPAAVLNELIREGNKRPSEKSIADHKPA